MQEKSEWVKPKCIAIIRRRSEEAVLGSCKNDTQVGYEYTDGGCYYPGMWGCTVCSSPSTS